MCVLCLVLAFGRTFHSLQERLIATSEEQMLYRSEALSQALNPVLPRLFVLCQVDSVGHVLIIVDEATMC